MSNINRNIFLRIFIVIAILFVSIIYTSYTNKISILEVFSDFAKELVTYIRHHDPSQE